MEKSPEIPLETEDSLWHITSVSLGKPEYDAGWCIDEDNNYYYTRTDLFDSSIIAQCDPKKALFKKRTNEGSGDYVLTEYGIEIAKKHQTEVQNQRNLSSGEVSNILEDVA